MLTDSKLQKMTRSEIEKILNETVFRAGILFERLQSCSMIEGDGYQFRKDVANFAIELLKTNWREPNE